MNKYPVHVFFLTAIGIASAVAADSGDWGVGFGIGVAIAVVFTRNAERAGRQCL